MVAKPLQMPMAIIHSGEASRSSVFFHPMRRLFFNLGITNGKVRFSLPAGDNAVRIGIYNVAGHLVQSIADQTLSQGSYTMSINQEALSRQLYLLKADINGHSRTMRITPIPGGQFRSTSVSEPEARTLTKISGTAAVDTLKVTYPFYSIVREEVDLMSGRHNYVLSKNHTWNGDEDAFWGDISTYPTTGTYYVILNRTNGRFTNDQLYYNFGGPTAAKTKVPANGVIHYPGGSGRFYITLAHPDSGIKYQDFMEHNGNGTTSWLGNTSRVDGFRLPITFRMHQSDGSDVIMGDSYEMFYQTREAKFAEFINEVGKEFIPSATSNFGEIFAPHKGPRRVFKEGDLYDDYFDAYMAESKIARPDAPAVTTAEGIFACNNGGMGSSPKWCAAVNRHVAHLSDDKQKDRSLFYMENPTNQFSRWTHRRSIDGYSYGFPYDDVHEEAAFTAGNKVTWVAVAIGW